MLSLHKSILAMSFCAAVFSAANAEAATPTSENGSKTSTADPNNIVIMELKSGTVTIELYPKSAPEHVNRIRTLVQQGFYDGVVFHRVIDGFMVQTGDPTGTGMGGSSLPNLKAEFNNTHHSKGVVSMARSADPNSANSQFFIMLGDAPHLDGQYTAFGKVISGMEYVDQIKKGSTANNGKVENPDKIISMKILSDTTTASSKGTK
ncbi:MAG: peptidylprolyl isomerase [Proteobacteria bacterium]|nr:peptidylprolyl isomerase [Pseudomonadota bacterium]